MLGPYSSLYALANLLVDLLNDIAHEGISTPVQYLNPDSQVPDADVEVSTKEENPLRDCNQSPKPCQPPQPTVEQLTSELTQSTNQNEAYVKLISELQEENKMLQLQIKTMEDIHKTISTSQRDQHERCALLKA